MKKLSFMVAAILVFASAPKVLMAAPAVMAEQAATEDVVDCSIDWTKQTAYNMWAPDDVKKNISVSKEDGLSVKNETAAEHFWDIQYQLGNNVHLLKGTDYSIKITMKGSTDGHATVGMGTWGCSQTRVDFTDQYATYTLPYTSVYEGEDGFILMQSGDFVGTISVKSIEVIHSEKATTRYPSLDLTTVDYTAADATPAGGWCEKGGFNSKIDGGACVISHGKMTNPDPWDAQVSFENVFPKGATIKLSMEVKGSVAGSISAGLQNPNGYKDCGGFPEIKLPTTDYEKIEVSTMCSGEGATRLLLNFGKYDGTVSIKNLKIVAEGVKQESLTIPSSSFATYAAYYPVDYAKSDLEAYAVKLNDAKDGVVFTKISGVVPAGVPVLLKGDANAVKALDKADGGSSVSTDLKVSDGTSASTDAVTLYALATVDGVTAFYPVKKGSPIPAKRCYLEVKSTSSKAAFYSLGTNFGETTGISSVENKVEKADAPVYNLAGQLVGKDYKGLVIKNGKKFVIK
jgi:hypothetical protein